MEHNTYSAHPILEREYVTMAVEKTIGSTSLAEVVDRILDKGVVIDAWARISLVGIELLAIEARVVVASVDTWLKYAEAVGLTAAEAGSDHRRERCWFGVLTRGEIRSEAELIVEKLPRTSLPETHPNLAPRRTQTSD